MANITRKSGRQASLKTEYRTLNTVEEGCPGELPSPSNSPYGSHYDFLTAFVRVKSAKSLGKTDLRTGVRLQRGDGYGLSACRALALLFLGTHATFGSAKTV